MEKRSISIAGHRTSVSLEPQFWRAVETMASERGIAVARLIRELDEARGDTNLSSSLRLAVLAWYEQRLHSAP